MSAPRPAPPPREVFAAALPMLLSMTSLCVGSSFAKSLFPVVGATGMTGLRNGLSAVILAALLRPWRWRLGRGQWGVAALYGAILAVMNLSFYLALARLPVGVAVAIEFLGPLSVALLSSVRRLDLVWVALAGAGVALLALPGAGGRTLDPVGVGFVLVAAAMWAAYILVGQRAATAMPGPQAVAIGLAVSALVTVPIAAASAGRLLLRRDILLSGLAVAVLCSAVPYPLEMIALKRLPRRVFGVLLSLEPAVGALAGLFVLGEHLSALRWLAIALVVAASAGVTLSHAVPAPTQPPPEP